MYTTVYVALLLFVVSLVQNAPMKKEECKKYLVKYGYLPNATIKEEEYKSALKQFQKTYSLPITGKLDVTTTKQMQKPRCGKDDKLSNAFNRNPWGKNKLTYKFRSFPRNGLEKYVTIKEFSRAFDIWAKHIPVTFEVKQEGQVDIDINFLPANRGDGPGKKLAYAYYPIVGDIYFDEEPWTAYTYQGTNLFNTAAHEIGHSLGLQHSNNPNALMNPYISPYNPNLNLNQDDINRIQSLYGKKPSRQATDICKTNQIDAVFFSQKEQALYVIKDNYCWKLRNGKIQSGYPKEITKEWQGIPQMVDTAYYYKNDIYVSKDTTIWKYDGKVKDYLTLSQRLTAAEAINETLYLFSGSELCIFDMSRGGHILKPGFPKPVSSLWKGAPSSVDAAYSDQKDYFYFFKESTVYKFNMNEDLVETIPLAKWLSC